MANDDTGNKFSSNLKVPPLKIVLSSHQNTFVNISSTLDDNQSKSNEKDTTRNENPELDGNYGSRRNVCDSVDNTPKHHRKSHKGSCDSNDVESSKAVGRSNNFSSSSSSSSSDRSATNTPSSESESLASNSTIISEHQSVKSRDDIKDETSVSRIERSSRSAYKVSSSGSSNKKLFDNPETDLTNHSSRDLGQQSNQRITRSSQRAAQQGKTDLSVETNNDEPISQDNQEKTQEPSRKVKRRKGEPPESEQEAAQTSAPTIALANIYPADYQLPSQNSFELYRDIRKQPYTKLMKLNHVQPKAPHGFKDYLINSGPYLLDGNKLGLGMNGSKSEDLRSDQSKFGSQTPARLPLRMKLSNIHQRLSGHQVSQNRHSTYAIPKIMEPPKSLQPNTGLYNLFVEQEKARQQMRLQQLKERERSILTAEQEILRAYNKAAIADARQKVHLSACTFFYYQERYHYLVEKSNANGSSDTKEVPHSQDNSNLCIEGGDLLAKSTFPNDVATQARKISKDYNFDAPVDGVKVVVADVDMPEVNGDMISKGVDGKDANDSIDSKKTEEYSSDKDVSLGKNQAQGTNENSLKQEGKTSDADKLDVRVKNLDLDSDNYVTDSHNEREDLTKSMSDAELKLFNKELFLAQLQEIDDKWDKIKREMFVRHRNESDSLYAVQSMEWEWKSKEVGLCDVRVSLKIDPELVPRVGVLGLDY